MEHLLRHTQIDLTSICDPTFFSGKFLQSLFLVNSWMVSPSLKPLETPAQTFHVYRMIASLWTQPSSSLLLPTNGLSLMDAKHIGVLTYYLFAMLNLTGQFDDVKFRRSLLGQQLKAWSDLPDNPLIHGIWQQFPRQTTYFWFQSLQSLLFVFQSWMKNLRYHPTRGFVEAQDHQFWGHLILDSDTPSPVPDMAATIISAL
jgi:hypothetical protein